MKKGYYITADGRKIELSPPEKENEILDVSSMCIKKLVVPEGYETVWCSFNKLTSLELPKGIKTVWCYNNQLTSLELSKGVKEVYCYNNQLTSLALPKGIEKIWCDVSVKLINLNKKETEITLYA